MIEVSYTGVKEITFTRHRSFVRTHMVTMTVTDKEGKENETTIFFESEDALNNFCIAFRVPNSF